MCHDGGVGKEEPLGRLMEDMKPRVLTHGFLGNRHMSVASHCSSGPMFQTSGAPT